MAAFVLSPPHPPLAGRESAQLDIFPGAATPTVFPARVPFWIGYGFTVEPCETEADQRELSPEATFELFVDGAPVALLYESRAARGRTVARQCVAEFENGLPCGWHRFQGHWYDAGSIVLTSDTSIEFVEP